MLLPSERLLSDGLIRRVPLTLRRRINWGDTDTGQIAFTAKFVDFAMEAEERWWEAVLGLDWYRLNVAMGTGIPKVGLQFDFLSPLRVGDRVDLVVRLLRLGRASLTLGVEGFRVGGEKSFKAELTACLIERSVMKSKPFPDDWRQQIEGYGRECRLGEEKGIKSIDQVVDFWFGPPGSPERGSDRGVWFRKDEGVDPDVFDAEIRERFFSTYEAAVAGNLDHWTLSLEGALALLLVLDQFPRNMFRGQARAWAADAKAREVAGAALERGFDRELEPVARTFFYLPFEHSEDLAEQERALELFAQFAGSERGDRKVRAARRHHEIVARFGRFPHRNIALGRDSTAEELAFLEEPNSSF